MLQRYLQMQVGHGQGMLDRVDVSTAAKVYSPSIFLADPAYRVQNLQ